LLIEIILLSEMAKGMKTGGRVRGTRNKSTDEIKALAQEHGPKALERLIWLAEHADNQATQVSACREILDRGYGKPIQQTQSLDAAGNVTEEISNLELARWVAHLLTKGTDVTGAEENPPETLN
jgi:hypothetical protein